MGDAVGTELAAALARQIERMIAHQSGRAVYRVRWDALDVESLREVIRVLRDIENEHQTKLLAQRRMPWRRL